MKRNANVLGLGQYIKFDGTSDELAYVVRKYFSVTESEINQYINNGKSLDDTQLHEMILKNIGDRYEVLTPSVESILEDLKDVNSYQEMLYILDEGLQTVLGKSFTNKIYQPLLTKLVNHGVLNDEYNYMTAIWLTYKVALSLKIYIKSVANKVEKEYLYTLDILHTLHEVLKAKYSQKYIVQ